jgi:hypothetical protein
VGGASLFPFFSSRKKLTRVAYSLLVGLWLFYLVGFIPVVKKLEALRKSIDRLKA